MAIDDSQRRRPARSTRRGVRRPLPARRAARAEGVRRPLPGAGRRDPRALPGAGRGRAGRGDLPRLGRGGAGRRLDLAAAVAGGRLPDRPRDRPRRHGGRLRGRAGLARPPGGPEGPALAGGPGRHDAGAVPPRGPRLGPAAPHQHRAGLRGRPGRRRPLLRDAVHPGPEPGRGHRRAAAAAGPLPPRAGPAASPGRPRGGPAGRLGHARARPRRPASPDRC